jgi:DNA-binding response OmpR family regulator
LALDRSCQEFCLPRILVVDDEPLISMLVEDWLVELGCEVVGPARSVDEGLGLVEEPLDGAILDVNLAGENCYLVANALQARGVPFAFATGDGRLDADSGFEDPILLAKPFNFDGVRAVLDKLLASPRTRDGA